MPKKRGRSDIEYGGRRKRSYDVERVVKRRRVQESLPPNEWKMRHEIREESKHSNDRQDDEGHGSNEDDDISDVESVPANVQGSIG